jgi:cytidine deaminase
MKTISNHDLIKKAQAFLLPRNLANDNTAGDVACALLSSGGNIYYGVCIDISSGIGFCAEHSAIAAMITAGESGISKIVAVWGKETILPPCGRCREFMVQVDKDNWVATEIVLGENKSASLRELLPHPYNEVWNE